MKLGKAWENRDYFTGKASELARQLAFSGIAVIWIFKNTGTTALVPDDLIWPLFLLVVTLFLDLLQYILASVMWTRFTRAQEAKHNAKEEDSGIDDSPKSINLPHSICFWLKFVTVAIAYVLLVWSLGRRL